jgi:hypothetical protein
LTENHSNGSNITVEIPKECQSRTANDSVEMAVSTMARQAGQTPPGVHRALISGGGSRQPQHIAPPSTGARSAAHGGGGRAQS